METIAEDRAHYTQAESMERRRGTRFGSTERVQDLMEQFYSRQPHLCLDRARIYTEVYKETEGQPQITRRAKAFKMTCEKRGIMIQPHELIVGNASERPRGSNIYPEWQLGWLGDELDDIATREHDPFEISDEDKKELEEKIIPYWKGKSILELWNEECPPEIRDVVRGNGIVEMEVMVTSPFGHFILPFTTILNIGWKGYRRRVEEKLESLGPTHPDTPDKKSFYKACLIILDGVEIFFYRHAQEARNLANKESSPQRKKELEQIADMCNWLAAEPPRTFREALQLFHLGYSVFYIEAGPPSISPGRFDSYMYPFYKKDIQDGILTRSQAQELLECLWIKMTEIPWLMSVWSARFYAGYPPFQNLSVGGLRKDGSDGTNDLSFIAIDAFAQTRTTQPTFAIIWHENTSKEFKDKTIDLVSLGLGYPSLYNQWVAEKMLIKKGYHPEEAHMAAFYGCVEVSLEGGTSGNTGSCTVNLGGMIELSLNDGVQRLTGKQIGLKTGDPRRLKSFDEFMDVVKKQISGTMEREVAACQVAERLHRIFSPYPFQSLLTEGCLEAGKDVVEGGGRINVSPNFLLSGVADIANSLAAVKKLVYENKSISMDELCNALETNFGRDGKASRKEAAKYEQIRLRLLTEAPKYGNDDDYVDSFVQEILTFMAEEARKYTSHRKSVVELGTPNVSAGVVFGQCTGALPSGRLAGTPLADGVSPCQSTDVIGPTGAVLSETKFDHSICSFGTIVNMWLSSDSLKNREQKDKLIALIDTFQARGGYELQFNVVDKDVLRDAQAHPEQYPTLMVRVAGYSAYFTDLARVVQDDIISRTEHRL